MKTFFPSRQQAKACFTIAAIGLLIVSGCSRAFYRRQADTDVYQIYAEKRCEEAYTIPPLPGIEVDPRSRFFDPSPDDCPALPIPEPSLYGYELPFLATGNPYVQPSAMSADQGMINSDAPNDIPDGSNLEELIPPDGESMEELHPPVETPDELNGPETDLASYLIPELPSDPEIEAKVDQIRKITEAATQVRLAELVQEFAANEGSSDAQDSASPSSENSNLGLQDRIPSDEDDGNLRIVPIPGEFWNKLPDSCLRRMMEFDSVRQEFQRTYKSESDERIDAFRSDAPRLTLPMITELSTFNTRALQTQKETLYRFALALSAERYEYLLRPTRRGNGTGSNFQYQRISSTSQSGLTVPTQAAVSRTTATAGQFLSSFANDVVLTFNGPQGFSANIASELLINFQQTIFQRDIVFEDLTRAERNVIYAARDYIRFQRSLFVDLAERYYQLLLTYRQIEISSLDYFSNLRAFLQGRAEYLQAGRIPRVQVDQFEQNALSSSSSLVRSCNNLETSLDRLKLDIGLPPEMALNLNLEELENLTASDSLTVTRELVSRTRRSLLDAEGAQISDRNAAVNAAIVLISRLEETLQARREIEGSDETTPAENKTPLLTAKLRLLEARLQSDALEQDREQLLRTDTAPATAFYRTVDLVDSLLLQVQRAMDFDYLVTGANPRYQIADEKIQTNYDKLDDLVLQWKTAEKDQNFDEFDNLVDSVNTLLRETQTLASEFVDPLVPRDADAFDTLIEDTISESISLVDQVETSDLGGLDPVDIETDDAMLLALYQRLDLANQRGDLADARRQIKLAADNLRSILDLNVSHRLFTNRNIVNSFESSADGSNTRLSFSLDTPLNRRLERNAYRLALIDYNRTRRALIEQEDNIKFSIREDLRQLRLRRNQYEISVARAALAYERVVSTRLQLQLSVGNVVARDFLEAQQAFTSALNSVASDHISFILDRITLFLDSESIRLNEYGYWDETTDDRVILPAIPDFYDANPNPYGRLPACLKYSDEIRQNH
ncbi:TolC family protein [Stieleria sp. JC731]|uniref:TolC family protein n=1 Tax=Pirellulaceae TaxID=2691357 RepID=UPI001E648C08|nr:TolC family protein [Stieleria sp. JC731]MCC9599383.1 TolC family protein [Stieleria sp. JC731]